MASDCPCCGYPGPAPTDDALWCRYRAMTEPQKSAFRKMANAIAEADESKRPGFMADQKRVEN